MRTLDQAPEPPNSAITTIDRDAFFRLEELLMADGLIDDEEWFTTGEPVQFIARGILNSIEVLGFNGHRWMVRVTRHDPAFN
jgi:hypothetical protein